MESGAQVEGVMGDALEAIRLVTILASPAMPAVCEEIWRRIGLGGSPTDQTFERSAKWGEYSGGQRVEKGAPLFPRIKSDA
jgi:methionyl-tRNA synthetase